MNVKELMKSPLFLMLAGFCVILLCMLVFFVTFWVDVQHEEEADALEEEKPAVQMNEAELEADMETGTEEETGQAETEEPVKQEAAMQQPKPQPQQPVSPYVSEGVVKAQVLEDSRQTEENINFLSITLDESQEPELYEVVFETKNGYRKYIYHVNANNGLLRSRTYYNADDKWDEENIFLYYDGDDDSYEEGLWDADCRTNKGGQSFYSAPVFPDGEVPEGYENLAEEYGIE